MSVNLLLITTLIFGQECSSLTVQTAAGGRNRRTPTWKRSVSIYVYILN